MLCGGLKLREGYDRIVTNNIIVNNTLHPHVWFRHSEDVFKHNIVFGAYRPAVMQRAIAKTPALPAVRMNLHVPSTTAANQRWMGAVLKEVRGSELSAFGVGFDKAGIAVESVADTSEAARTGLRAGDLIQAVNGERTVDFNTFSRWLQNSAAVREITLIREQQPLILQRKP